MIAAGATIIRIISVVRLGVVDYASGLRAQSRLVELRKAGQIGDVLLLLEHTPVITLGRNAKAANVLASPEALAARGVEVFECDRGGDVTFHGPGQLVGYPIFDLRGFSRQPSAISHQEDGSQFRVLSSQGNQAAGSTRKTLGAVDYVRRLEEVLIRTCAEFAIATKRVAGLTGVWRDDAAESCSGWTGESPVPTKETKIAAIGVHISRSVTSHGFALNVNTDLSFFDLIVPCGITAKSVTSMEHELGHRVEMESVADAISRNFGVVFGREMGQLQPVDALLGNTVGVPMKPPAELRQIRGEDEVFLA